MRLGEVLYRVNRTVQGQPKTVVEALLGLAQGIFNLGCKTVAVATPPGPRLPQEKEDQPGMPKSTPG